MTKPNNKSIAPLPTGSAIVAEAKPGSAVEDPAPPGALYGLIEMVRAAAAALDRAWNGRRSSWSKLAAWTATIGHAPKAPLATAQAKPKDPSVP